MQIQIVYPGMMGAEVHVNGVRVYRGRLVAKAEALAYHMRTSYKCKCEYCTRKK